MFVGWMSEEAEVDEIKGLSPCISIDQKTTSRNPRSTVGTITEIYDYYKLLYLNIGERRCSKCWTVVKKDSFDDVIWYISSFEFWEKFMILFPLKEKFWDFSSVKEKVLELWFIRFNINWKTYTVNDSQDLKDITTVEIVVDRLTVKDYSDDSSADSKRIKDSLELAFKIWKGLISIQLLTERPEQKGFSNVFMCSNCWHIPKELNISSFSFNSHSWACETCHWLWVKKIFLEEKIINPNLTLLEWAVIAPGFGWDYFFALLNEIRKETGI